MLKPFKITLCIYTYILSITTKSKVDQVSEFERHLASH